MARSRQLAAAVTLQGHQAPAIGFCYAMASHFFFASEALRIRRMAVSVCSLVAATVARALDSGCVVANSTDHLL